MHCLVALREGLQLRLEAKNRQKRPDKQLRTPGCFAKNRMGWLSIFLTPQLYDNYNLEHLTSPCHTLVKKTELKDQTKKQRLREAFKTKNWPKLGI